MWRFRRDLAPCRVPTTPHKRPLNTSKRIITWDTDQVFGLVVWELEDAGLKLNPHVFSWWTDKHVTWYFEVIDTQGNRAGHREWLQQTDGRWVHQMPQRVPAGAFTCPGLRGSPVWMQVSVFDRVGNILIVEDTLTDKLVELVSSRTVVHRESPRFLSSDRCFCVCCAGDYTPVNAQWSN